MARQTKPLNNTEVNRGFKEKFSTWQYNAYKYGLSEHQLNEDPPSINRKH